MNDFATTKMTAMKSKRNKLSSRLKRISQYKTKDKNEKKTNPVLNIYAVLSKNQYEHILNNDLAISVPYGTKMRNKSGSRGLYFECDSESTAKELMDGLDASGVSWQEND